MRLIVLDVDGTLIDSQHAIVAAQGVAFAAFGLVAPTREQSLSVVGLSLREAFAALAGPDAPLDGLAEAYKQAWTVLRSRDGTVEPLYPGAAALVAELAATPGTRLALATGKSRRGVERILDEQGWRHTFATTHTADEHPSKPHPAMLVAAMAAAGTAPEETAMIGDTTFDMAMAVAAGVRPLGVAWGYHPAPALLAAGAEAVAESFEALRLLLGSEGAQHRTGA